MSEIFKHQEMTAMPPGMVACDSCAKPDIYLIVADEYAGNQELKELFGYDNSPFFNELKKRGFQVKENPRSNYNFTPFSVASILNFDYLPLKDPGHSAPETGMVTEMIKNSRLQQFLQASGYQVYNCSTFDLAGLPTESAEAFLPAKTKFITAQTFLSRLERDIFFNLITRFKIRWIIKKSMYHSRENNKVLYSRTMEAVGQNKHPKFVYTHLTLPHFPYFFDENGKPNDYDSLFEVYNRKQYLSYLKYGNKKYLSLIDFILKNNPDPPLIILMSDHGYRDYRIPGGAKYLFMNICAIYDPYAG
ncbi:MAG TPA: sulfatase-like hydrolase/transferase [Flavisolibacter sp.]|nr:sulfatase-like hydrolase/transferase [Flavisolibacter sp.]